MVLGPSSNGGLASLLLAAGAITAVVLFAGGGSGGGGYAPPLAEGEGVVEEEAEALPDIWSHRPPMPPYVQPEFEWGRADHQYGYGGALHARQAKPSTHE